jgi:hypothetical protein
MSKKAMIAACALMAAAPAAMAEDAAQVEAAADAAAQAGWIAAAAYATAANIAAQAQAPVAATLRVEGPVPLLLVRRLEPYETYSFSLLGCRRPARSDGCFGRKISYVVEGALHADRDGGVTASDLRFHGWGTDPRTGKRGRVSLQSHMSAAAGKTETTEFANWKIILAASPAHEEPQP